MVVRGRRRGGLDKIGGLADLLGGFDMKPLSVDDPIVQERIDAFYQKFGLVKPWQHPALSWFGLFKNDVAALIVSVFVRPDNSMEVTNFYPAPTRDGVNAGYVGLGLLKTLVDFKVVPYWIGPIPRQNESGRRHAEKFFGIKPRSMVYCYDGSTE